MIQAVVFDLDGVLLDSEKLWDEARRQVVAEHGGAWQEDATGAMQGMSSREWARYMRDELDVPLEEDEIVDLAVAALLARYEATLPLAPGAVEAVRRLALQWPLGLASSSNRVVIERVLDLSGLRGQFSATVSSEEVARGKPSPDVYLEASRALGGLVPRVCVAVEDSASGIRAALAAGMRLVVIPNPHFPPEDDLLERADRVVANLDEVTVSALEAIAIADADVRLDEEEVESFPASDPHSDWAGPGG